MRIGMRRLIVLATAVVLIGAACGDDNEGGGLIQTTEGTSATASSDASPEGGDADGPTTSAGPTPTEPPPTTSAGSGDDAAPPTVGGDIEALMERYQNEALRLTYEVGDSTSTEVMILAQDPTRVPPLSSFAFPDTDTKVIQRGDEMILCDGSECFAMPGAGGDAMLMGMVGPYMMGLLALSSLGDVPGYDVDTQPVTIAGRNGLCITFEPSAALDPDMESARQCVDSEFGFTLLMEFTDRGATEPEQAMLLLEFDRPRPEDFEPTGPVIDMPGG